MGNPAAPLLLGCNPSGSERVRQGVPFSSLRECLGISRCSSISPVIPLRATQTRDLSEVTSQLKMKSLKMYLESPGLSWQPV